MIKSKLLKICNILISIFLMIGFLKNNLEANDSCRYKAFNIRVLDNISIKELLGQLNLDCDFTMVVKDRIAKTKIDEKLSNINIKNRSLEEIFDILLKDNNLDYSYIDGVLKIKGIETKTFKIDYITSDRTGKAVLNASVQSSNNDGGSSAANDENQISTSESFNFWKDLSNEILSIANSGSEDYVIKSPIINQNAGLITVTGTPSQINRVGKYLNSIKSRLDKEVLIDVSIISVVLDKSHSSGVDWTQFALAANSPKTSASTTLSGTSEGLNIMSSNAQGDNILHMSWNNAFNFSNTISFTMNGLMNFLKTQGYSRIVSSPKVLTLNNQQALITIGDNINYRIPETAPTNTGGSMVTTSYTNASVFVGILLNIMPQISDDNEIMLRINPSISSFKYAEDNIKQSQPREIAPDTTEKKLSSVVRVKNGDTIILGGLIGKSKNINKNGVPGLKELPILGNLFKSKTTSNNISELIFVITPRVVEHNYKLDISLRQLGYSNATYK